MAILVDTSALVTIADADEIPHQATLSFVAGTREPLLVPSTVLPEVDYLLTVRLGSHSALAMLRSILSGEFHLQDITPADLARCLELMSEYSDSQIGLVDASIVAIAERLHITRILTLDRRHFRMIRPRHCAALELIPE